MTPLDDEVRDALHARTSSVTSSPDFFAGVESKARRMRRNRAAGAVAGSALAVTALGLGGPLVASSLTGGDDRTAPPLATMAPEPPPGASPYALDPDDPWAYRGDDAVLEDGNLETFAREWGTRHAVDEADVRFTPLYGELYEPAGAATVVFLAEGPDGGPRWGVVQSSEAGPELLLDEPLREGDAALPAALPGDEVGRLLVVAAPEVGDIEYGPDAASGWSTMESIADGVAVTALDGDPATDRFRVLDEQGGTVTEDQAPDVGPAEGEGPGTQTPVEVDDAAYALDLSDPWAYRGPAELTQHPGLGAEDERLFTRNGRGRGDGSFSSRPLLAVEGSDGLSVLLVLHRKGDEAYVTTTWQRQDETPRQSEQAVRDGQLLVQSFLPDAGPGGVLLALASPKAGAVETDLVPPGQAGATPGVGIFELPADPPPGQVLLYSQGDGLLYHSEPARRS